MTLSETDDNNAEDHLKESLEAMEMSEGRQTSCAVHYWYNTISLSWKTSLKLPLAGLLPIQYWMQQVGLDNFFWKWYFTNDPVAVCHIGVPVLEVCANYARFPNIKRGRFSFSGSEQWYWIMFWSVYITYCAHMLVYIIEGTSVGQGWVPALWPVVQPERGLLCHK